MAQAAFDEAMASKVLPERWGEAWAIPNKPMRSRTIFVPATELALPEPHRCRHGRRLPHTTLEGDCTAEGTSIRTAEGEDACVYKRTEPAPAVYPAVWFPPLDFDSGIIKVGVGGVYKDDAAAKTGMRNLETGVDKSETDMDKSDSQTYE